MLEIFLQYKLFLIPIIVLICAQLMKFARLSIKYGLDWDDLFNPGHFPSAHSAFVTALVITIGYYESITSGIFAVSACFAFITIYDAMRIRMHIGLQGKTLNKLITEIDSIDEKKFPHLKEHVGHYTNEIAGGICVGVLLSTLLIWFISFL